MLEYLITTGGESGSHVIYVRRFSAVLRPHGFEIVEAPGEGDYRIAMDGTEVAFYCEDPGWQVVIEGAMTDELASAVVQKFAEQLGVETGQTTTWNRIT